MPNLIDGFSAFTDSGSAIYKIGNYLVNGVSKTLAVKDSRSVRGYTVLTKAPGYSDYSISAGIDTIVLGKYKNTQSDNPMSGCLYRGSGNSNLLKILFYLYTDESSDELYFLTISPISFSFPSQFTIYPIFPAELDFSSSVVFPSKFNK